MNKLKRFASLSEFVEHQKEFRVLDFEYIKPGFKFNDGILLVDESDGKIKNYNDTVRTYTNDFDLRIMEKWISHFEGKNEPYILKYHLTNHGKRTKASLILWSEKYAEDER